MQMVILVLNNVEKLDELLMKLNENGIHGATIISSAGMARTLFSNHEDMPLFGFLRAFLDPEREESKVIFTVLPDELVDLARNVINDVVGDFTKPDSGILFGVPVSFTEGIGK